MFSGKSEELIRRVRRAEIAHQTVQVFKPSLDNRYGQGTVNSHDGRAAEAVAIESVNDILAHLQQDTTVVAIDEAQFLNADLLPIIRMLVTKNVRVIIAGLDMDFRGEPFGPMPQLIAVAEQVDKLHAICVECGGEAWCSQRLINGKPARANDPIILIGAQETYEARCRECHQVPD
jgi:thymidine kinase